ncbi:hypothetical protein SRB5_47770 [Streptomyces sp. RB5]|uniref:Uncharacterized protein n=1 Tax=Streptomyces smaragdinus TaxID=2585196 RepID=A0A7K0CM95_9ACTN|nr:hypothetical protein [Streptomyces smaragdinus]MQY14609.1 hypothetical protein [Streptomyces smaragdinus]
MSSCDGTPVGHDGGRDADLPVNPFLALRARFGMLLGEDDFHTLIGNARGKLMLHNAWLHGSGVVHGYRVGVDTDTAAGTHTLRVSSGLAVDGLGRELYLGGDWCADLATLVRNFAGEGTVESCDDERVVEACLAVRFAPCPASPVPALADPCDLSRRHTSDSRVVERVRLELRPGRCPSPPPAPYHRVRVLLGLDGTAPGDLADCRAAREAARVAGLPGSERAAALLDAFHRLAAEDAADLTPFTAEGDEPSLFPRDEPGAVMLAGLRVRVRGYGDQLRVIDHDVDLRGRPTLLPTVTVADLVCGLAPALMGSGTAADAGGPRVEREAEWPQPRVLRLGVTAPLLRGSLADHPVAVTSLSENGWVREDIARIEHDPDALTLTVVLHDPPAYDLVRVIVRGTGPTPVFGAEPRVPLAGLVSGPPGGEDDGHDAVLTLRASRPDTGTDTDSTDAGDAP